MRISSLCCCLLLLLVLVGTVHAAIVPCVPETGTLTIATATYAGGTVYPGTSNNPITVTCGPMTFSNFVAVDASGGNAAGEPLFLVSPSYWDGQSAVLSFNPSLSMPGTQDIHLFFHVESTVPIGALDMSVGGTAAGITERACTGDINAGAGTCAPGSIELAAFSLTSGRSATVAIIPSTSFNVVKDVGKGAGGELTFFQQSFSIPEPGALSLIAIGLITLGLLHRRK